MSYFYEKQPVDRGFVQLKDAEYIPASYSMQMLEKDKLHYMNFEKPSETLNLAKHDIFPGYINHKPLSLQKMENISRNIEGSTSTNSRHFTGRSFHQIQLWMNQKNYLKVILFVFESILDILKEKLVKLKKSNSVIKGIDDLLLLE